jgi:hypothetical protein
VVSWPDDEGCHHLSQDVITQPHSNYRTHTS